MGILDNINSIITDVERVFYVIRNRNWGTFVSSLTYGLRSDAASIDEAVQFPTFDKVVDAYAGRSREYDLRYEIVKVTRKTTNGVETRRVLEDLEVAPFGERTMWAIEYTQNDSSLNYLVSEHGGWTGVASGALQRAGLFATAREALVELQKRAVSWGLVYTGASLVRVAVSTSKPVTTDILTVLP